MITDAERSTCQFQSTLSVRRATTKVLFLSNAVQFQSTLSVRRATYGLAFWTALERFQSTLSVRRATEGFAEAACADDISIHALREESDDLCG